MNFHHQCASLPCLRATAKQIANNKPSKGGCLQLSKKARKDSHLFTTAFRYDACCEELVDLARPLFPHHEHVWVVNLLFLQDPHINGGIRHLQHNKSVLFLRGGGIVLELQHAQKISTSAIMFAK